MTVQAGPVFVWTTSDKDVVLRANCINVLTVVMQHEARMFLQLLGIGCKNVVIVARGVYSSHQITQQMKI